MRLLAAWGQLSAASGYSVPMKANRVTMKLLAGVCGAFLIAAGPLTGCGGKISDRSITVLTVDDLSERLAERGDEVLVLDARDRQSFEAGHVPGARLTRLSEIDVSAENPRFDGYDAIVVYGDDPGSGLARALVKRLLESEHDDVYLLEQGFTGWRTAGGPVATGSR